MEQAHIIPIVLVNWYNFMDGPKDKPLASFDCKNLIKYLQG
jgi:hypothetical protein